jgi:PAS domain S-box-containing protein
MSENPTYEALKKRIRELEQSEVALKNDIAVLRESEARYRLKLHNIFLPEGDVGMLQLSDIIDLELLQSMMDNFFKITHIGIGIIDLHGNVLIATGWQDICTRFHRVHPETCRNCLESDIELSNGIEPGIFRLYRCKNNMWDIATPITVGGKHLGNLFLGQFIFSDESPDMNIFRAQACKYGFNAEEYLAALERVPRWSRETVNTVMTFYMKLAHMISELTFSNISLVRTLMERDNFLNSLLESEQRYRTILQIAMDGFCIADLEGNLLEVNDSYCRMTGYGKEELLQMRISDIDILESPENTIKHINKITDKREDRFETRHRCKDGRLLEIEVSAQYMPVEGGRMIAFLHDITDYKHSEKALMESEERFRLLVKNTSDIIAAINPDGTQRYVSQAVERITGYRPDEVIGKSIGEVIHPDDMEEVMKVWYEALAHPSEIHKVQYRHIHKTKEWVYLEAVGQSFIDESAIRAVVVSVRDITALKHAAEEKAKLEAQLLQSQKMEAIGSLAGGIAHDLNNILFPISGLSEMLIEDFPPGSPENESLEQIYKSAQRGSDLVKQILAFSRQSNLQKLPIRIQPILKEVLKLFRATIPQNIEITSHIEPDCGMISADPTQMHQVLMNLITNAYHAVEQTGGMIHIELTERPFTKNEWFDNSIKPGRYAVVTVSDTGTGIDQMLIDRIYEPYFTTKKQGKGTGLGLSVVHGIIKEYGGDIRVYSEVGKGTVFHVYLPLLEDAHGRSVPGCSREYPTGHERILLIDDEEPIAQMIQMILERLGYLITVRTGSLEALDDFKADPLKYDLVISDRGMPKMTGMQLAGELIAIRPEIPIIICTGFTHEEDEYRAKALGIKGFLIKPVAIADLAVMVRNVLDGRMDIN